MTQHARDQYTDNDRLLALLRGLGIDENHWKHASPSTLRFIGETFAMGLNKDCLSVNENAVASAVLSHETK